MQDIESRLLDLEQKFDDMHHDIKVLREVSLHDVNLALNKMRYITEKVLHKLCMENGISWGQNDPTLENMIGPLIKGRIIPKDISTHVRSIQSYASPGSHFQETPMSQSHTAIALMALVEFLEWVFSTEQGPGLDKSESLAVPQAPQQARGRVESEERRNLLILLSKVRSFWIEGVLNKSLYREAMLDLGKELTPERVAHPWEEVLAISPTQSESVARGTKPIELFDRLERLLLIVGDPGSGKTITLLELAKDLLVRAENDPSEPIPVVLNLSSWTNTHKSLSDWVEDELRLRYQIPKRYGSRWVKDGRLLLLLDGLDEVREDARDSCVKAINAYVEEHGLLGLAVASRSQEYTELAERLKLNGAVHINPLTQEDVDAYLGAEGSNLEFLRAMIQRDENLRALAKTPLMLNIMCLSHEDIPIEFLQDKTAGIEKTAKVLLDAYIESMFRRKEKRQAPYTKEQVMKWLSWLAGRMEDNSKSIFHIEELQPSWLESKLRQVLCMGSPMLLTVLGLVSPIIWLVGWWNAGVMVFITMFIAILSLGLQIRGMQRFLQPSPRYGKNWVRRYILGWDPQSIWHIPPSTYGAFGPMSSPDQRNYIRSYDKIRLSVTPLYSLISGLVHDMTHGQTIGVQVVAGIGSISYLILLVTFCLAPWDLQLSLLFVFLPFLFSFCFLERNAVAIRSMPNGGIIFSLRYSLMGFAIVVLLGFLMYKSLYLPGPVGMLMFILLGGWDVIAHYTLRLLIHLQNNGPLSYPKFLDYASRLIFMQKVGGGYVFIHRVLLEHFASPSQIGRKP